MSIRWLFFTLILYGILFSPWALSELQMTHGIWAVIYSPQLYFLLATALIYYCTPLMRPWSIGLIWPQSRWWIWPAATFVMLTLGLWLLHLALSGTPEIQKLKPYSLSVQSMFLLFIMAPVAEELFFRGVVFHTLQKFYALPIAVGASSLLFMSTHTQLWLGSLSMGLIAAWWTYKSRSILPGIVFHMLCNALPWFIFKYFGNLGGIRNFLFF